MTRKPKHKADQPDEPDTDPATAEEPPTEYANPAKEAPPWHGTHDLEATQPSEPVDPDEDTDYDGDEEVDDGPDDGMDDGVDDGEVAVDEDDSSPGAPGTAGS